MKVSVLLLTHNEEANLPRCLDALTWCDDIVAIDSGSTDRSLEVLESYGVRILERPFDDFATQRNFGLVEGGLKHEWVLHLDADEEVTSAFKQALDALPDESDVDAYVVPSKLMLADRWLKHAGGYPVYQARLGHRDRLRFTQVGHGQREHPATRIATFSEPYLHYNFSHGMKRWLEKHVRYASEEAALIASPTPRDAKDRLPLFSRLGLRRMLKRMLNFMPYALRPPIRFLQVFIFNQGFRDGTAGLAYAVMISVYEGMVAVFAYERWLAGRAERRVTGDKPVSVSE